MRTLMSVAGRQLADDYNARRTAELIRKDSALPCIILTAMTELETKTCVAFLEEAGDGWAAYWALFCIKGAKVLPPLSGNRLREELKHIRGRIRRAIRRRQFDRGILQDIARIPQGAWNDLKAHRLNLALLRFDVGIRDIIVDIVAHCGDAMPISKAMAMKDFLTYEQVMRLELTHSWLTRERFTARAANAA
jgi:hypothetical protein